MNRFNANLYTDGKVCLSLLGKDTGASVVGTDKWNPDTSSLWQVLCGFVGTAQLGTLAITFSSETNISRGLA